MKDRDGSNYFDFLSSNHLDCFNSASDFLISIALIFSTLPSPDLPIPNEDGNANNYFDFSGLTLHFIKMLHFLFQLFGFLQLCLHLICQFRLKMEMQAITDFGNQCGHGQAWPVCLPSLLSFASSCLSSCSSS